MEITVRGQHLHIPERFEERAQRKLARIQRYLPLLEDATVEVDLTQQRTKEPEGHFSVHVTMSAHGVHLQTQEHASQPDAALDLAVQVLSRQARRHKERLYARGRDRSEKEAPATPAAAEGPPAALERSDIVARMKRFPIEPMTTEEALKQMETLGHDFFLYHDIDADQFAVLYRRRAGDFGLILPEMP